MFFQNLRNLLVRFLGWNERKADQSTAEHALSEKSRLLHRLNCIDLNENEVKCVQAYLTTLLEARHQDEFSNLAATDKSNYMVFEMNEEELKKFSQHIGGNDTRLFHTLIQSNNSRSLSRKLTIIGNDGICLFHVLVQGSSSLLHN